MSVAFDLSKEAPTPEPPRVFSRLFSVPAGAPWEQQRAAQLEARHGSPLPITELTWRLRRLGGWAPGRVARYAVFYVRTREFSAPFETTVEVDGEPLRVSFGAATDQLRRLRGPALAAVVAAVSAAVLGAGVMLALGARGEAEQRLAQLQQIVQLKDREGRAVQARRAQERELAAMVGRSGSMADVMTDLGWAAAARAPDARISAVHWDRGLLAVEARGEAAPFATGDRRIERSARPIRPGVWLWGVSPRQAPGARPLTERR